MHGRDSRVHRSHGDSPLHLIFCCLHPSQALMICLLVWEPVLVCLAVGCELCARTVRFMLDPLRRRRHRADSAGLG
ncbi:hypothetical protein BDW72DRAFT_187611 [Aspergillus terricola var. indicus]